MPTIKQKILIAKKVIQKKKVTIITVTTPDKITQPVKKKYTGNAIRNNLLL